MVTRLGVAALALLFMAAQAHAATMMRCDQPLPDQPVSCHEEAATTKTAPPQPEDAPPCCTLGMCAACVLPLALPQNKAITLSTRHEALAWPVSIRASGLQTDAPERPPKAA